MVTTKASDLSLTELLLLQNNYILVEKGELAGGQWAVLSPAEAMVVKTQIKKRLGNVVE